MLTHLSVLRVQNNAAKLAHRPMAKSIYAWAVGDDPRMKGDYTKSPSTTSACAVGDDPRMKGDYTPFTSRYESGAVGDDPRMKGDYTHRERMSKRDSVGDDPRMKGDYTLAPRGCVNSCGWRQPSDEGGLHPVIVYPFIVLSWRRPSNEGGLHLCYMGFST